MSGHYDQSHASWEYEDGNRRMRAHYSQQNWSSHDSMAASISSHQITPTLQPPAFDNTHQQMHAAAMSHHQAAMSHHQSVMNQINHARQSSQENLNPVFSRNRIPPPPVVFAQPQTQLSAPTSRLAIGHVSGQLESSSDESEEESSSEDDDTTQPAVYQQQQPVWPQAMETRYAGGQNDRYVQQQAMDQAFAATQQRLDAQRQALEQRYLADQEEIRRQSVLMGERMRKLEDQETKNRAERDAKALEMRQLRDENLRLMKQSKEEAQKHQREIGDLARMYANKPRQAGAVFDTSTLEKMIREVQLQQPSREDIDRVIQDRVDSQLDGLVTQKDLEAAGSRMEKALSQLPSGVSTEQIQQVLNQELGKAVDKLASKVQSQRSKIEDVKTSTPRQLLLSGDGSHLLPDDLVALQQQSQAPINATSSCALGKHDKSRKKEIRSADQQTLPTNLVVPSEMQQSQSLTCQPRKPQEVHNPGVQITSSLAADSALMKVKKTKKGKEKSASCRTQEMTTPDSSMHTQSSSQSIQHSSMDAALASPINVLTKIRKDKKSAKTPRMLTPTSDTSAQSHKSGPLATLQQQDIIQQTSGSSHTVLPDDFPENASQITSWERSKSSKKSRSALPSIAESSTGDQSLVKKSKRGKGTLATVSDAIARRSQALPTGDQQVIGIPSNISSALQPNMMTSLQLPADFPDNASQISTWERKRAGMMQPVLSGASPMAQIEDAPGTMHGQELVRSSKPKKHGSK